MVTCALLPIAPLVRVVVGPVPLYLTDPLLAALALRYARPGVLPRRQATLVGWGAAALACTLPSVLIGFLTFGEPAFTTYYFARRVLAWSAFATFLAIFSSRPRLRRPALAALLAGLVVTSVWCVGQAVTRGTGPIGLLDHLYYQVLSSAVLESAAARWGAAWKTVRAIGGWWNANSAGAAIVLLLAIVPALPARRLTFTAAALGWLALLATASRQSLAGGALCAAVTVLGGARGREARRRRLAAAAGLLGLVAALALAGDQVARVVGHVEGGLDESFASRWNNYPEALEALAASPPWTLLFGRGAEGWTVVARTHGPLAATTFVSNTFLLVLLENGVLAFLALIGFFVAAFLAARPGWQRGAVVLVLWLMNCDNHLYLLPPLTALAGIVLALATSPVPSPTAERRRGRKTSR